MLSTSEITREIEKEIARLTQALALLQGPARRHAPSHTVIPMPKPSASAKPPRKEMSAAARGRISLAQKKRWRKYHREQKAAGKPAAGKAEVA
jgi:hypothetical protein